MHVTMSLVDPRQRPVRAVIVGLSYDKRAFRLLDPPARIRLPAVTHDHPYNRTFDLRVLATGKPIVEVGAQSVNASPEATITPTVGVGPTGTRWSIWAPLAGVALGVVLLLAGRQIRAAARTRELPTS